MAPPRPAKKQKSETAIAQSFVNALKYNTEEIASHMLDNLVVTVESGQLEECLNQKILMQTKENPVTTFYEGLLLLAVTKQYPSIVKRLLIFCKVDEGTTCESNIWYDKQSPLMAACEVNNLQIAEILLEHQADVLHQSSAHQNILMKITSVEMLTLVMRYIPERNNIIKLLLATDHNKNNALHYAQANSKEVAKQIVLIAHEHLHLLRDLYWSSPDRHELIDKACKHLKNICREIYPSLKFSEKELENLNNSTMPTFYKENIQRGHLSFFKKPVPREILTKAEAIQLAIAQSYALFKSPAKCIPYLKFLNSEFIRYFNEKHDKHFSSLDPNSYSFEIINGLYYPAPKENFKKLDKHNALPEFLISLLRQEGLANRVVKWMGYIPQDIANKMVQNGDFIIDEKLGRGIFHGSLVHDIQTALTKYAIDNGEINVIYQENGETHRITLIDILSGLVTYTHPETSEKLWLSVRDERYFREINFIDPYRLISIMMSQGKDLGIKELADYMISSFCQGILNYVALFQQMPAFANLTVNEFFKKMNEMQVHKIIDPRYLLEACVTCELFKGNKSTHYVTGEYAVFEKTYSPNEKFEPKPFKI